MLVIRKSFFDDFVEDFFSEKEEIDKIKLYLPGVGKENIEVLASKKNQVTVKWKTVDGKETKENKRTYTVIPFKDIEATYIDGVLDVKIKPEEENEPIKIKIA